MTVHSDLFLCGCRSLSAKIDLGMTATADLRKIETKRFSFSEARSLVHGLSRPQPRIYWTDFLLTILCGYAAFFPMANAEVWEGVPASVEWPIRGALYFAVVCLFMRAAMFTHELVHLPKEGFTSFRVAWNLLCGVPFLIPSFTYYPHVDHHRRKSYGTEEDGEYLNLSHQSPWKIVLYMALIPLTPIAGFLRFAVLTPIGWIVPAVRRWNFRRASTMVMDIMYHRPEAGKKVMRTMLIQEVACFLFCMWFAFRWTWRTGVPFDPLWLWGYLVSVGLLTVNNIRTLGAHRWTSAGSALSFEEQLLDSCDYPYRPWITELWGPIGTRYHATHHLFPSIPYHNLGAAHRALKAGLPADNIFHDTTKVSLLREIAQLWKRAIARERGESAANVETPAAAA